MQANIAPEPIAGTSRRDKQPMRAQIKRVVVIPLRLCHRAFNAFRSWLWFGLLNLFCDFLVRWGDKFGISGNFRARMFWKAGRSDIVPLSQLYDYMMQEQPLGEYYPETPNRSSRSEAIVRILAPLIMKDCSILEIGCNAGRNLNHLWQTGYTNLRGMEISEHAVRRLRAAYPCLAMIPVDVGPAEQSIKKYESKSVDVIFTMSVLEHLHPDCGILFKEIARVARKYVLAFEPREGKRSHFQYPWNIMEEFTAAGLSCVSREPWSALWPGDLVEENEWAQEMYAYDAFLFRVNQP